MGMRISFGDSCGGGRRRGRGRRDRHRGRRGRVGLVLLEEDGDGTGVVAFDVLELALLLDVVRGVVGRQGGAEPADVVLLADGSRATGLAEEREVRRPHGVGGGEERADRGRST